MAMLPQPDRWVVWKDKSCEAFSIDMCYWGNTLRHEEAVAPHSFTGSLSREYSTYTKIVKTKLDRSTIQKTFSTVTP